MEENVRQVLAELVGIYQTLRNTDAKYESVNYDKMVQDIERLNKER